MEIEKKKTERPSWGPQYIYCPDTKDADAVAKAVLEKDGKLVDYPFKFPEMKPYEVRGKILYTGICQSDCDMAKSIWWTTNFPLVAGHEIVSEITHVGSEVTKFKVGDKVGWAFQRVRCGTCYCCKEGKSNICVGEVKGEVKSMIDPAFGGFATHVQAPADTGIKIPEGLPLDKIPPLMCAGTTLYAPIKRHCGPNSTVGIIGCGGIGHMGIKIAKALGHEVVAFTTKGDEKAEDLKRFGAHKVVSSLDHKEMYPVFESIDVLLITVHNEVMGNIDYWMQLLKHGGLVVVVGLPKAGFKLKLDCFKVVWNQIGIVGTILGTIEEIGEVLELAVKDPNVIPEVTNYEWKDWQKAFDTCMNSEARYRGVINCGAHADKLGLK